MYFLETIVLLLLSVFLAIICYLVSEFILQKSEQKRPNVKSEKHDVTTENPKKNEVSKEALNFYLVIMIGGLFVGFFVYTISETFNAMLDKVYTKNFPTPIGISWAILLIASSILLWQLLKWVMGKLYQTPVKILKYFDMATVAFCIMGILAIIFLILR